MSQQINVIVVTEPKLFDKFSKTLDGRDYQFRAASYEEVCQYHCFKTGYEILCIDESYDREENHLALNGIQVEFKVPIIYLSANKGAKPKKYLPWQYLSYSDSYDTLAMAFEMAIYKKVFDEELTDFTYQIEDSKNRMELQASDMALMAEKMAILKNEAVRASSGKSKFLRKIMFQFTSRMNGVLGLAQILCEQDLDNSSIEKMYKIRLEGESLYNHIQNVLNLTYLENGELNYQDQDFQISTIMDTAKNVFMHEAKSKGVSLHFNLDRLDGFWFGGAIAMQRAIFNLIENALKATIAGEINIKAYVKSLESKKHFCFEISNDALEEPHELKKTFQKIEKSKGQFDYEDFEKNGNGLYITYFLLRSAGGDLRYEFKSGVVNMIFDLPLRYLRATQEEISVEKTKWHILIVEDNTLSLQICKKILSNQDCETDEAVDGNLGFEKIQSQHYDLIFLDCHMPGIDGYELTRMVRRGECGELNARTPIIALTASVLKEDREKCLNSGMSDYLGKPIRIENVKSILAKWRGRKHNI